MPATGFTVVLLVISVVLAVAAVVRRSRRLAVLSAASFAVLLGYTGLLYLVISRM